MDIGKKEITPAAALQHNEGIAGHRANGPADLDAGRADDCGPYMLRDVHLSDCHANAQVLSSERLMTLVSAGPTFDGPLAIPGLGMATGARNQVRPRREGRAAAVIWTRQLRQLVAA